MISAVERTAVGGPSFLSEEEEEEGWRDESRMDAWCIVASTEIIHGSITVIERDVA